MGQNGMSGGYVPNNGAIQNGSNGLSARFADVVPLPEESPPIGMAPLADPAVGMPGMGISGAGLSGSAAVEVVPSRPPSDDTTRKMLAALATGILIGFIIARLFF